MFVRTYARRSLANTAVIFLLLVGAMLIRPASNASAAALTNLGWSVSNTTTSSTGNNYAWNFKTATAGTIFFVVLTLPAGTTGTPAISQVLGIGPGTVGAISGNSVTYTVTATQAVVTAGFPIYIELSGFTNTPTAGGYTSSVTTQIVAATTLDGPTTSNSVSFAATGVATTVAIAKSSVFSIDTNSFDMLLDPALNTSATQAVNVGISSNARLGYSLNCKVDKQPTNGSFTLGAYQTNMGAAAAWASGGAGKFGYAMSAINNGTSGTPASGGTLSSTNFAGFVVAGENCASATGKTGNPLGATSLLGNGCGAQSGLCDKAGHAWLLNIKAAADYTTEALIYTNTITLTLTPNY